MLVTPLYISVAPHLATTRPFDLLQLQQQQDCVAAVGNETVRYMVRCWLLETGHCHRLSLSLFS